MHDTRRNSKVPKKYETILLIKTNVTHRWPENFRTYDFVSVARPPKNKDRPGFNHGVGGGGGRLLYQTGLSHEAQIYVAGKRRECFPKALHETQE